MIPAIFIISLAFIWLGYETDWLRVRLLIGSFIDLDIDYNYDGSDSDYLADYESQLQESISNAEYQSWLDEYHAPKYRYGTIAENQIDRRDRWMAKEEGLQARRNGEMLYQRGI